MFRFSGKAVFIIPLVLCFLSCSFADLRPVGVTTVPSSPWELLPEDNSPVILRFDTEMEKLSAERAVQVFTPDGTVDGKLHWEGRSLHFISDTPWRPGIRYALKLSGTVKALDGREAVLSADLPFFALSRTPLPYVKSFFPPDGASVGVRGRSGAAAYTILELNFSRPMDKKSAEHALKFDIPGEKIIEWQDDGATMLVSSNSQLNPWITYRWSVSDKALSREGAPLAKEYGGRFITDLDREFIRVVRVLPLMPPEPPDEEIPGLSSALWGSWLPSGPAMDPLLPEAGPGSGHGIGVEFSKPVDEESLRRAFSFTPSLSGRAEILSPHSAVFIPAKEMESETVYQMRISGALKDTDGLKMGSDYIISFKTDIPFLHINSVSFMQEEENNSPESGSLLQVKTETGGIVRCFINFSLTFKQEVKQEAAFKISLTPFFPGTLAPVSLRTARWISADRLLLEWEGPEYGGKDEAHYYRLLVPGGLNNGRGSHLKENFVLYLEVIDE